MTNFAVIIAAAGKSSRFQDKHYKKPFVPLANKAVWLHSAERFLNRDDVKQLMLVIASEDRDDFNQKFGANVAILGVSVVEGGQDRADSVQAALSHVSAEIDFVAIHDAARPCLADEWIDQVFQAAQRSGAAILATPITHTLKHSSDGKTVDETVAREGLWAAQTPQVFRRDWLLEAYAKRGDSSVTDDAQLIEQAGHAVTIVPGAISNIKITSRGDLRIAEQMLKALPRPKLKGPAHPFADDDMWR